MKLPGARYCPACLRLLLPAPGRQSSPLPDTCPECAGPLERLGPAPARPRRGPGQHQPGAIHRLELPDFTPTPLNELMRGSFRQRVKSGKDDRLFVSYWARQQNVPPAHGPRRVALEVTVAPGQRRPDEDALWKSTLDALAHAGLLVNDSPRWCRLGGVTWSRGPRRQTVVVLEDLAPEPPQRGPQKKNK